MSRLSLGLDIGGTFVKAVLAEPSGKVAHRSRWRTPARGLEAGEVIPALDARIEAFLSRHALNVRRLASVGLACAGLVDVEAGLIHDAPNLRLWEELPIGAWMDRRFPCPSILENDVNALAYGEWLLGAGRGTRHMLCLALGTGVGGGLILDGRLYRGHNGLGAELGHMSIEREGRRCGCGNRGCLEAYAGAVHLERAAGRALSRRRKGHRALSRLLAGEQPTPLRLSRAARAGDPLARELFAELGRALGVAIANYINVFAPERVVLAGGLSAAGSLILDPARDEARSRLMKPSVQTLDLRLRELGNDGAALGAALLAKAPRR